MAKSQRQMDPPLDAVIRDELEGDEIVLDWSESCPGEVLVRLISAELHSRLCSYREETGQERGSGRSLWYKSQDGEWVRDAVGGWAKGTVTEDGVCELSPPVDMAAYRLDNHPSSYYASQFDPDKITVAPYRAKGHYRLRDGEFVPARPGSRSPYIFYLPERPEQGVVTIAAPVDFRMYLPSQDSRVEPGHMEMARSVLEQISEMDAEARSVSDADGDEDGATLAYVEVGPQKVRLHYVSNTVNAEWGAYFKR